ncbi:HoxN/HupN/NixA family nickel/cobalt transporter [Sciscionella marina]|uniref:HoxN/HupN/NixA family nickel/cobalt transporter n=1 Tax=Sciscionella marina TaxID=508770 RepID=UPI00058AF878|nr:HoxN/HupN/NixA family nickel/cobalt transporter [Sciscionella marina]
MNRSGSSTENSASPVVRAPWRTYVWMYAVVAIFHILGWVILLAFVVPGNFQLGTNGTFGIGLGVTAYTLGLRHAFDADHIAAIDNTTRKLQEEHTAINRGNRPVSVGFWFSLGHSTVVVVMVALIAFGLHALAGEISDQNSVIEQNAGLFGASISGIFLLFIGGLNLLILVNLVKVFRRMRHDDLDESELEHQLDQRGFLTRFFGRLMRFVRRPSHIYPIGVLFGFGFDTVTEVALLAIAGAAAIGNLPWYAILVLPILFTAGMTLMDTTDGAFMNAAYGWAFARPVRKVFYNITVTAVSVLAAIIIGIIELLGVIAQATDTTTGVLGLLGTLDLDYVGYAMVAVLILSWGIALAVWHFGNVENRWNAKQRTAHEYRPS